MRAINLKTNHLTAPVGIDAGPLFLSWQCADGVRQTAYEIELTANGEMLWHSGKTEGAAMHADVPAVVGSRVSGCWRVRLWDENDVLGAWSEARFETGLAQCDWVGEWVDPETEPIDIPGDDAINACLHIRKLGDPTFCESHFVMFCTKNGVIKKTCLTEYSRPRTNGVNAITIREDDRVVSVCLTNGENEIILANRNGRAIRFAEDAVRTMGRTATGVRGMLLDEEGDDEVVGMVCVNDKEQETVMVVSEKGYGKRSAVEDYRMTNRGGKGVKTLSITEKTGKLVAIKIVTDDNDLMIINKSGITLRLKVADVRVMGRATQGVRLINLGKRNDTISSVCHVSTDDDTEDESIETGNTVETESMLDERQAESNNEQEENV